MDTTELRVDVTDFDSAVRAVLAQMRVRLGLDVAYVARVDQGWYRVLHEDGDVPELLHVNDIVAFENTFCAKALAGEGPSVTGHVDDFPAYRALCRHYGVSVGSLVTAPIPDGRGGLCGTLCGYSVDGVALSTDDEPLVRLWADLLGLVLSEELAVGAEWYRSERAERRSEIDVGTGLGNRHHWDRVLGAEQRRVDRYGSPTSVITVGVHGWLEGSERVDTTPEVLAGSCLRAVLPLGVQGAHLGGETFALMVSEGDVSRGSQLSSLVVVTLVDAGLDASVGLGVRSGPLTVAEAWQEAERDRDRDLSRPSAPSGRVADRSGPLADLVVAGGLSDARVQQLLALTREHLDTDVALVAEIRDGRWIVRFVSARVEGWEQGLSRDAEETICRRVITGELPGLLVDLAARADLPLLHWSPSPIGAYIGVPLQVGASGTRVLCCFTSSPRPDLDEGDRRFVGLIAGLLAAPLAIQEQLLRHRQEATRVVKQAQVPGGLDIAFQPVVDLLSEQVVGYEALSRPLGLPSRSPVELFDAAEEANLTVEMELFAARLAVEIAASSGYEGSIGLNFSAATLLDPLLHRFLDSLDLTRVWVELSEHSQVTDYAGLNSVLVPFRARGMRLAVDDAGAGFASFHHILRLRPNVVKLDIALVRSLTADDQAAGMVSTLAEMGTRMGSVIVAEGIEDADSLAVLRSHGLRFGQGFHLGRPGPLPGPRPD